jgi:hypothetical protein
MESPILIDLWTIDPSRQQELVQRISELIRSMTTERPGFISAEVYESVDGHVVLVSVRMRSVEDRQKLMDSSAAHAGLRELRAIAKSHARLYRQVESFGAPDSDAPPRS